MTRAWRLLIGALTLLLSACATAPPDPNPPPTPDTITFDLAACADLPDKNHCAQIRGATFSLESAPGVLTAVTPNPGTGYVVVRDWPDMPATRLIITAPAFDTLTVEGINPRALARTNLEPFAGQDTQHNFFVLTKAVVARRGIVRVEGRTWIDDDGPFHPLGATLFWSLQAVHKGGAERVRWEQQLAYLQRFRYDYIRILGQSGWSDYPSVETWSNYDAVLADLIDTAYDKYGLRVELTLWGGGPGNPVALAEKAARVVAVRPHKVLSLEAANEAFQNLPDVEIVKAIARVFTARTPNLVATSSAEAGIWNGIAFAAIARVYAPAGVATHLTIHMDRGFGDEGWRTVRQPWDWRDVPIAIAHNEPIGPRSSVAEETDPLRLAMLRASGILMGARAFVLHNGQGVTGQPYPPYHRQPNLWEGIPNIDAIMTAVRGVARCLPARFDGGQYWNNQWAGHPIPADAIWPGSNHGVNRHYLLDLGPAFYSVLLGVKGFVVLTPQRGVHLAVCDPLQGIVRTVDLAAGQAVRLEPASRDNYGNGAYVLHGRWH